MASKKIIIKDKDYKDMEAWEKIFFMFLSTKKSYPTKTAIAEATKEYWNTQLAKDKEDPYNNTHDDTTQGAVSKCKETLEGTITYKSKSYTIRKITLKDDNGNETEEKAYCLLELGERELLWYNGKEEIQKNDYLIENELCVVSKYMYLFKYNQGKRKHNTPLTADKQTELLTPNEKDVEKIIKIKKHFAGMIAPDCLFSVSYFDGNIVVVLNDNASKKNIDQYSYFLKNFWKITY